MKRIAFFLLIGLFVFSSLNACTGKNSEVKQAVKQKILSSIENDLRQDTGQYGGIFSAEITRFDWKIVKKNKSGPYTYYYVKASMAVNFILKSGNAQKLSGVSSRDGKYEVFENEFGKLFVKSLYG